MVGPSFGRGAARLAMLGVAATLLAGCSQSTCSFVADEPPPSSGTSSEASPRAALRTWLAEETFGAPDDGWRTEQIRGNVGVVSFRTGAWTVEVQPHPEGGFFVSSVACSSN